jgi:hypothetical protein
VPHLAQQIGAAGPIIDARVWLSAARRQALAAAGQPLPAAVPIRALVDTGASCTCIDPVVLKALGLAPTGVAAVHTPSTSGGAPHMANQYDVSLVLVNPKLTYTFHVLAVMESDLQSQGTNIDALLGRDALSACLLVYDGQTGIFTLAF